MGTRPVWQQLTQTRSIRKCGLRVMLSGWLVCFWMFSWRWPGLLLDFYPRSVCSRVSLLAIIRVVLCSCLTFDVVPGFLEGKPYLQMLHTKRRPACLQGLRMLLCILFRRYTWRVTCPVRNARRKNGMGTMSTHLAACCATGDCLYRFYFVVLAPQPRKGRNVCDKPKLAICSPVHSNQPVRPGARVVFKDENEPSSRFDSAWQRKTKLDFQGFVDGSPIASAGHILWRCDVLRLLHFRKCTVFWFKIAHCKCTNAVEKHDAKATNYELNVTRHAFSCWMRLGDSFYAYARIVVCAFGYLVDLLLYCFPKVFQHAHRMG